MRGGLSCHPHAIPRTSSFAQMFQAVHDAGYTEPTPIQIAAIPLILAGNDVIGIARLGQGKTAAFVLPILMKLAESKQTVARHGELTANPQKHNVHRLRALVLAPTRELVVQIGRTCAPTRNTFPCAWPPSSAE